MVARLNLIFALFKITLFKVRYICCFLFCYAPRKISGEHIVAALSVRPSVSLSVRQSVRPIRVRPITSLIGSRISKLFYRNDHHVRMTCRVQDLGPYFEGQGHSATLHQNRVRSFCINDHHIETTCRFSVSNTYSGSITRFRPTLFSFMTITMS